MSITNWRIKMSGIIRTFLLSAIYYQLVSSVSVTDRESCKEKEDVSVMRVNSTERLQKFRTALSGIQVDSKTLSAFIIYSGDAHDSEYPTKHDKRRDYISGFEGSAGIAVITTSKAALWTDGRYFVEAEETLDCNWILMKSGVAGTPGITTWLNQELQDGDYVGVDKTLVTHASFISTQAALFSLSKKLELKAIDSSLNPVDEAWGDDQPPQPNNTINALELKFSGLSWQNKVENLRENLTSKGAGAFVATALEDVAWLFNLRGTDVEYTPFFLAYAVVEKDNIRLYILDKDRRLTADPTDVETKTKLHDHLNAGPTGSCSGRTGYCVEVLEYNQAELESYLTELANRTKVWVTYMANYAVYLAIQNNYTVDSSPIEIDKAIKNPTERSGMKSAYNRDSAELIKFLAFLENEIKSGKNWTEVSAGKRLDDQRKKLQFNRGLSFETIAGYGSNGAIIHYRPLPNTDKRISTDTFFLLDSGGQYLDGTTDVTRTLHYGTPTSYEKECYTRVLMSSINLAMIKWPQGLRGRSLDTVARSQLWEVGLDFNHGTGHGIGAYLSVHEGPGRIYVHSSSSLEPSLKPYEYYSDEPGYYEDGKFGIRLETIVTVVPFKTKYNITGVNYLQFEPVTLVPFEPHLIDWTLLSREHYVWLNEYNTRIKKDIVPLLGDDQLAIPWVNARTQALNFIQTINLNSGNARTVSLFVLLASLVIHFSEI